MYEEIKNRVLGAGNGDRDEQEIERIHRDLQASEATFAALRKIIAERDEVIRLKEQLIAAKQSRIELLEKDRELAAQLARLSAPR
jgi:hypothetical protein